MKKSQFTRDLNTYIEMLCQRSQPSTIEALYTIRDRLLELKKRNLVKINHSIMEVLCAWWLAEAGYNVKVEQQIDGGRLNADIFATRQQNNDHSVSGDTFLVEVETGYVPPSGALKPRRYREARISSKMARYSGHSLHFALAVPNYHLLQTPHVLLQPVNDRLEHEVLAVKEACDIFYHEPPIDFHRLFQAEIHSIFILDIDSFLVTRLPPEKYLNLLCSNESECR